MSCQPLPLSLTSKSKAIYFGKNLGILIFPITLLYKLKIVRVKVPSWTWYIIIYVCVACCPPVVETVLAWVSTSLARLFPDWRSNLLVLLTPRLDRDWSAASVNTRLHCQSSVQWATRQGEEGEERERERESWWLNRKCPTGTAQPWWDGGFSQWRAERAPALRSWNSSTTGTGERAGSGAPAVKILQSLSYRYDSDGVFHVSSSEHNTNTGHSKLTGTSRIVCSQHS